jgi:shikimate dehydrogenase
MNKKFLVIGNPIEHSLSPKLHNYWIKKNNIKASYEKKLLKEEELKKIVLEIREEKIHGINITVPFKKTVIPFLDMLTDEANKSQSVNTIYKIKDKIIGDNTDIEGFKIALESTGQIINNKTALILGAGGVAPSIIVALKKLKIKKIFITNRTEIKVLELKKFFPELEIVEWGRMVDFDIIINATSIGLNEKDEIKIDYEGISRNKFFYDVIYNPEETNFLKKGKKFGAQVENGKKMFIHQAQKAFFIWHGVLPEIDTETINLLSL